MHHNRIVTQTPNSKPQGRWKGMPSVIGFLHLKNICSLFQNLKFLYALGYDFRLCWEENLCAVKTEIDPETYS